MYPKLILNKGKEQALKRFHPWIFSGAIKNTGLKTGAGEIVEVYSSGNDYLATGHYQQGSIAVRVLSFEQEKINQKFWTDKIRLAYELRKSLNLAENPYTNVYRLVFAEGDNLPGLIVDFYNGTAVLQAHSIGMYHARMEITQALAEVMGDKLKAVYDKSRDTLPANAGMEVLNSYLYGTASAGEIMENNNKFFVDWEGGQKTGFFIDQRENRDLLTRYTDNKQVLNTFSYTGGFSVYALNAGAKQVHSVDSSKKAIELTDINVKLNGKSSAHQSFTTDVFDFLKDVKDKYDVIILDPPAFAKSRNVSHNAVQGYKRINAEAIRKIKKGGVLFTFSCSQVISRQLFTDTVIAAAIEAGRKAKIIHHLSQPVDHPVNIFHPEGEYLKGLVLYMD